MDKILGAILAVVLFALRALVITCNQSACAARQCPTSYTPTLTRDGCVCLMKAK